MILRDHLAFDRTILANERTFLAYSRTFVVFFASGISILELFEQAFSYLLGSCLLVFSIIIMVIGIIKFINTKRKMYNIYKNEIKNNNNGEILESL